ncbi:response regulator transcription factor [Flectobacillus major]|uniref:response regulator transcription factor n=1 Tax=Flectobacillus major TaxID=103 RepID=UPI0004005F79|nr:response regulator transcription factor [Flectobacillus major]
METIKILVVSRNESILQVVLRLINQNPDWQALGTESLEEALSLFAQIPFNLVLLGSGISEVEEQTLRQDLQKINPNVMVIQHYGGGSGLLACEIKYALETQKVLG